MRNMKYLKLYEAFDSEILSGTVKFLTKQSKNTFLSKVTDICNRFDFPLSRLDDTLFKYLPYNRAIMAKPDSKEGIKCSYESEWIKGEYCDGGKVKRTWGKGVRTVECPNCGGSGLLTGSTKADIIKYWFDKDGKFIKETGSDGTVIKTSKLNKFSLDPSSYKKGEIIERYEDLKKYNGSLVYFYEFASRRDTVCYLHVEGDKIFLIQNNTNSWNRRPNLIIDPNMQILEYNVGYFDRTYASSRKKGLVLLKHKLDLLTESEYTDKEVSYNRLGISLNQSNNILESLKDAHFAIVMDISKIKSFNVSKSKIKTDREESKSGAYAMLKNDDIRRLNLNKYINEIASRTNFSSDALENFKSFIKVALRLLGGRNILYHIMEGTNFNSLSVLYSLSNKLHDLITRVSNDDENAEYYLSDLNRYIESHIRNALEYKERVNSRKRTVLGNIPSDAKKDIYLAVDDLSSFIYDILSNKDLETIEDFEIFIQDIKYIKQTLLSDRVGIAVVRDFVNVMSSSGTRTNYGSFLPNHPDGILKNIDIIKNILKRKIE